SRPSATANPNASDTDHCSRRRRLIRAGFPFGAGGSGLVSDLRVAGVRDRVHREADQPGGDDAQQERSVGVTTIRARCPKTPIAVKPRLTLRLISRVFESSRNFLDMPLSITTSFSWWQCIGRSFESSAALIRVPRTSSPRPARTDARRGVNTGTGAPAHNSTRTSTWSASELAIELALFFTPILGGFRGLEPGGRDDGERQSAPSAAADAGGEVGSVPGGHLPAARAAAPAARRGRARTLAGCTTPPTARPA